MPVRTLRIGGKPDNIVDGRGPALARTAGEHDRHDIGFIRMSVLRKIPYEKPCIGREYFAYPGK